MIPHVVSVRPLAGHELFLEFDDGTSGVVDLGRRFPFTGVFAPFADLAWFRQVRVDEESGTYVARIPGDFITPKWDVMYFVEAIDKHGNGRNYPDLEVEMPYVIVPVERGPAQRTN